MVEQQPSKLNTRVRFPSPAPNRPHYPYFQTRRSAHGACPLTLALSPWERESARRTCEGVPSPPSAFASECGCHKLQARQGELAEKDRMRGNALWLCLILRGLHVLIRISFRRPESPPYPLPEALSFPAHRQAAPRPSRVSRAFAGSRAAPIRKDREFRTLRAPCHPAR
jgi:hypothetical protein